MSKENYASFEATLAALIGLGFKLVELNADLGESDHTFLDSPKIDGYNLPIVQISIYQCRLGWWCVSTDGGYMNPCVWNGPKADYDKEDTLDIFVKHLDNNFPGWR